MNINRFVFLATLCSAMAVFAGPVGNIIFNNDTTWDLSIKYKVKGNSATQEIIITNKRDQNGSTKVLPIAGLESLRIEAVPLRFYTSPTANDGKKILSEINENKTQLTGEKTVDVTLSLSNNTIDTKVKITKGSSALPDFDEPKKPAALPYDQLTDESYVKKNISKKDFDAFVAPIPASYRMKIVQKAVNQLAQYASKDPKKLSEQELFGLLNKFFKDQQNGYQTPLVLIGTAYGMDNFIDPLNQGYVQFSSKDFMKGKREDQNIMKYDKPVLQIYANKLIKGQDVKYLIPIMFGSYKIHLMPPKDDLLMTVIKLIETIQNSSTLRTNIASFKVAPEIAYQQAANRNPHTEQNGVVVIYTADGKKATQEALDELYKVFKGAKGMNVRPRYNARVNDLIWIGQGDSQVKEGWEEYYDKNGIYYKPEEFGRPANEDLKLKHPSTGKDLVDIE